MAILIFIEYCFVFGLTSLAGLSPYGKHAFYLNGVRHDPAPLKASACLVPDGDRLENEVKSEISALIFFLTAR